MPATPSRRPGPPAVVVFVESDFAHPDETLAAYRRRVTPPRRPTLTRRIRSTVTNHQRSITMKKFAVILAVALLALLAVAGTASAAAPFARFSEPTAFNGAHAYARAELGAGHLTKVAVDCMKARPSGSPSAALWVCSVDTFSGLKTPEAHATVGVLRKGGSYVFRTYDLVEVDGR